MKMSRRSILFTLVVCCLAVAAGVMAERAFANGSTVYCADCTLPSSGVPAMSGVFKDFYYNDEATANYVDAQIYNYYSNTVTCSFHGDHVLRIWTGYPTITQPESASCVPSTTFADARCHLLDGTGPSVAYCYARYETAGEDNERG
jgi:hypothetical protein